MSSQKKHGLHSSSTPIQGHQPCSIPSNPAERSTPQSSKPDLPCDNAGQEQESSPKSIAIIATFQTLKDTDLSQRLWDEAFGNIIADENEKNLAENYLVALKNLLQKKKADDMKITRKSDIEAIDVSVQLRDPAKRQVYLHDLLKTGLDRVEKVSKFSEYLGNISEAVLATKPAVDLITSSVPQAAPAAVPWAGVCLGLQVSNIIDLLSLTD
jgi:hypothetical protein